MTHNVFASPNFAHFGGDADIKFRFGAVVKVQAVPRCKGGRPLIKAQFDDHFGMEWSPANLADFIRQAQEALTAFPDLVTDLPDLSGSLADMGE